MTTTRSSWGSRFGFIFAAAGSAIGLGAIWKFPYVTAMNGGGVFLLLFLVFTAWPVIQSVFFSFTDIRNKDLRTPFAVDFVAFENYARALSDPTFLKAAGNTAYFVVVGVPLTLAVALAAAVLLDRGITRLRAFFRLGFYTPVITSIVAVAVVWRFLLQPDSGLVNTVIPLRGSLEGFSANTLGLIGSTYFLGFFLGTFIAPRLIRRMGPRPVRRSVFLNIWKRRRPTCRPMRGVLPPLPDASPHSRWCPFLWLCRWRVLPLIITGGGWATAFDPAWMPPPQGMKTPAASCPCGRPLPPMCANPGQ